MVQYLENYKKNIAIDMRKKGMSYSEIENRIHVPKSTLSFWLKKIKLTEEQEKKLNKKKFEALKKGSEKKIARTLQTIKEIKIASAKDIKEITKKELWLMGIMLYWRERFLSGNESDLRKGVKFTSSDPYLIKFFLKWLQNIGRIDKDEIVFDIFINKGQQRVIGETIGYWSDVTDFPEDKFNKIYYLKSKPKRKRGGRKTAGNIRFGLLRIRVKASSMLARQMYGWVRGIIRYYWD